MELSVGMYVRAENGTIAKITKHEHYWIDNEEWNYICTDIGCLIDIELIIKTSHNIIDLIEVGDYVNGYKVFEKDDYLWIERLDNHEIPHFTRLDYLDIKSIVTKEQFESMNYKVGE